MKLWNYLKNKVEEDMSSDLLYWYVSLIGVGLIIIEFLGL